MHSRPCSVFAGRRVASFVRREFEVHDAILVSMIARVRVCVCGYCCCCCSNCARGST